MAEYFKRFYQKEEEFLDLFPNVASKAATVINEWKPDYTCDDSTRKNREYFLSTGELKSLVFDSAAVYHNNKKFSSAQISLKSSDKVVTIRVKKENGGLIAEKVKKK